MDIDWLDYRDLERSAMRDRHGFWRSLFRETDPDIAEEARKAVVVIADDMRGYADYSTRLNWLKRWKRA